MIFFILSIVSLVFVALLAAKASGLSPYMYGSTKDFVNAKCSFYNGARMFLFPAYLTAMLGVGQLTRNPGIEGYVTELATLTVLLTIGFFILSWRIGKLQKMIGKNIPIEMLEGA